MADSPRLVAAGRPFLVVLIVYENADMMPHKILFVQSGTRQAVAEAERTILPDQLDNEGRACVTGKGRFSIHTSSPLRHGSSRTRNTS